MPAKGHLSLAEKKNLQHVVKTEENPKIRERALMLLLLNDGKTYEEIAEFVGCSSRRVAYWCVHGDPNKLETLEDGRAKGNYKKTNEEYTKLLLEIIDKEPKEFGYEFGRWTGKRLSEHLEKETGIKLSKSQISRILSKSKYVYIWGKYSLEDKQDKKKEKNSKKN
jgi:transposase